MGIDFSKVAFTYEPSRKKEHNEYVLKDVNLHIDSNDEFICVVGHTGSGKSTLMQLMNALVIPQEGSINNNGIIIDNKNHRNLKEIRQHVGLVFQFPEYQLFEETVLKDVSFGPKNFKLDDPLERAKRAMKLLKLDESFFEKNPFMLSGGQMRKVAISGILASDPDILILDEPTVGLDPITKRELVNLLKEINKVYHKTIMIVTHDMDVVWEVSKRVIVIDDNLIIYDGNKYDLFKNESFLNEHSLDLPELIKLLSELKNKLHIDIDPYQDNLDDAVNSLKEAFNHE